MTATLVIVTLAAIVINEPAAVESNNAACELHIWPSEGLMVQTHGMWDGFRAGITGGVIGGANTPERRVERSDKGPSMIAPQDGDPLSTAIQAGLIANTSIAPLLDLPKHQVIVHQTALGSRTIRNTMSKYLPDSGSCYADLVVDDVVYSREWSNGIKLKTFFRFRNFAVDGSVSSSFGTWVQTGLKLDPKKKPEHAAGFETELNAAFAKNFSLFAISLKSAATKAKKK